VLGAAGAGPREGHRLGHSFGHRGATNVNDGFVLEFVISRLIPLPIRRRSAHVLRVAAIHFNRDGPFQ